MGSGSDEWEYTLEYVPISSGVLEKSTEDEERNNSKANLFSVIAEKSFLL
jgi:hypothetical protein